MRLRVPALLALPFLITMAALRGLTVTLPIFHGSDERVYHMPTILRFGSQLPTPDLAAYHAAQTPLFHLVLAVVGQATGYQLWRMRLVEMLISYGLALALFALLHRRLRLPERPAVALSLMFALSPYVFGESFRVMTDNLAALFVVIAVERLERYRETRARGAFGVACLCVGAAILTRQSAAFLLPVAGLYALWVERAWRGRALGVSIVALAAAPAAALFLTWHGLVPPGGDPASCGLCSSSRAGSGLALQTPELMLATVGLYGAVLFARQWRSAIGRDAAIAALAGAAVLLIWPARPVDHAAGLLWRAGSHLPTVDGSSLLFWVLVPLAGAVMAVRLRVCPRPLAAGAFLGCFLLGALAIRNPWQKYVDPFALLALMLTLRETELAEPRELLGALVLSLAFVAYAISFVS